MSVSPPGRVSGLGHLGVLFPKATALCLVAAGGFVLVGDYVKAKVADPVAQYCRAPTQANLSAVPVGFRTNLDEVCACLGDPSSKHCRGSG